MQAVNHPILPAALRKTPRLDRWVRFERDGTVTVASGKVEFGQGISTAMIQIAAEELDVPLSLVRLRPVDTDGSPDEGITSGSRSVNEGGLALALACAEARQVLLEAAARLLDVEEERLYIRDGTIQSSEQGRSISYWELPHEVLLDREATGTASLKPPTRHTVVGTSVPRTDIAAKVLGKPAFIQDLELPGMLFGRVLRPPSIDARLVSFDTEAVEQLPGVVAVVRDGRFIGIVAETEEQALKALRAAARAARWMPSTLPTDDAGIYDFLTTQPSEPQVIAERIDPQNRRAAGRTLTARYTKPYLAHASIGPSCALARVENDRIEVWTHTQSVYPLRRELALVLNMRPEDILVHHVEGAGCYGHNGADDVALDAVLLSRAVLGRPVQVQWMREDEFAWEPYGPAMVMELSAAIDSAGRIVDWTFDAWSNGHLSRPGAANPAGRASALIAAWHLADSVPRAVQLDPPMVNGVMHGGIGRNAVAAIYDFPNERATTHRVEQVPLRASSLRSIAAFANVFAIESFIDELAAQAGMDCLEYRLIHLRDPRARAVLEVAAQKASWRAGARSGSTAGRGIACAQYSNHLGYCAIVAEIGVDPDIHVQRVVAAVDVGRVINPDGVINQTEGGVIQAISWTLKEQVRFGPEGVTSLDWETYPILIFPEVPAVEVHLVARPHEEPLGAGEIALGPTAAAIANAVHNALGVRIRDLPITRERVVSAA